MTTAPVLDAPARSGTTVLDRLGLATGIEQDAARQVLVELVTWADEHPGPGIEPLALGQTYADHEVALAGPGAPGVSEFDLVEVAAILRKSTAAAKRHLGDALELCHRLPRTWARILRGDLEAWQARRVAQQTKQLCASAAAWVDATVAPRAHKIGPRQLARIVEEAVVLFDPETAIEQTGAETWVHITPTAGPDGAGGLADYAYIDAKLPLTDALALEQAVAATAHTLLGEYPDHDLDERRALALGRLADTALADTALADTALAGATLQAAGGTPHAEPGRGATTTVATARALSLVVHLDQAALKDAALARVHTATGAQHLVTVESVAAWCLQPGTKVTIRPVIDLATPITCTGYVPSPALRAQVAMLSPTCCFPHCTIPAERCDDDHITPHADRGATDTWNLAPLCRLHHRLKTFTTWTYTQTLLGTYHWTSPTGRRYRRDRDGTTNLDDDPCCAADTDAADTDADDPTDGTDPPIGSRPIDWS